MLLCCIVDCVRDPHKLFQRLDEQGQVYVLEVTVLYCRLCVRDPHKLFQRLDEQGQEYVFLRFMCCIVDCACGTPTSCSSV